MEDLRLNKRVTPPYGSSVVNQINDHVLGKMVDVSVNGFLLAGRQKYSAGMIFQLKLNFPLADKLVDLSVGAECIWSDPQTSGLTFGGFQIIDISEQDQTKLNAIIEQLIAN
jgi:hypothetical protein